MSDLSTRDLDAAPEGTVVKDATGDRWVKDNGVWICFDATMNSEALVRVWGPITEPPTL